ncbi:putative bifunctional diguanylate cyclase/phosphodiesterase [Shewanella subflava]|uniref:Bifunctional diguanylate cyclase/phosphodiesterase n=1 Tax=Shewanella subflava TaxID=2986476 RepID=A0ABT3I933_9GAMM|nr:bifunctional diguanylate cyclase/phosphodiesterase [Shewanella subflava]MCW3172577.1 bifunctional diguanylate cyclase/phosphodiesterase [Shewanella subflava]
MTQTMYLFCVTILAIFLGVMLIAAGIYYWHQKRYLQQLTHTLERQIQTVSPVDFGSIPQVFTPLITALINLQKSIPFNVERDKLTGLSNRVGFKRKMLSRMPIQNGMILLIDIKQFRFVNDLFGFVFGDALLKEFSLRVNSLSIKAQFVARMNGNEFLLFFSEVIEHEQLLAIKDELQQPFEIEQQPISVTVQLGVLTLTEHHADVSIMLRRLDLALKKAKLDQRAIAYYDKDDDKKQYRELLIINSLPKALKQDQLFMVYQPKLDIKSAKCVEVEALIRWHHEGLGEISPDEFIPLAEHTGMISLISAWVLEKVISQQAKWREQGIYVKVAVNLSSDDLHGKHIVADITNLLKHYSVPAECLMIEITESALMASYEQVINTIEQLQTLGIKVAIDDFGTGHSSLAYLRHLPVNEVKIDKAFLQGFQQEKQAQSIVKMTIVLAKELGFDVTVEGVETLSTLQTLAEFGADRIQGEYFSKPCDATEFTLIYPKLSQG